MDKKKKELLILLTLIVIFILIISWSISATSKKLAKNKPKAGISMQATGFGAIGLAKFSMGIKENIKSSKTKSEPEFGRDPFTEKKDALNNQQEKDKKSILKLEGISWDSKLPFAVINSEVVVRGDVVEGYRVIEIKEFSVRLEKDGQEVELRL